MNFRILPAILALAFLLSCTVYKEYPIEVYKPGELRFPSEIKHAAIVYRNFKYPEDTLQNFYRKDDQIIKDHETGNTDSTMVIACMNELALRLKNQQVFDEVVLFPYHTFDRHVGDKLRVLPADLINRLTKDANAGLLISLETFSTFFSIYSETDDSPLNHEVVSVAVWGIYNPKNNHLIERRTLIDTIYWNGYDYEGNLLPDYRPPPRTTALELASAMAGESYARRFYPSWQTEKRMYSVPPLPDFSDAALRLEEGKWDEAIELWKKYAGDRNGKMAIDARYNLALAYEMKDDLEMAGYWLTSAEKLAAAYRSKNNLQMIYRYQKALESRLSDNFKLWQPE